MGDISTLKIPTLATIKETWEFLEKKAKENNTKNSLSEYRLRQLALTNQIVHIRAGKKILINLEKLGEYLNVGSVSTPDIAIANSNSKYPNLKKISV